MGRTMAEAAVAQRQGTTLPSIIENSGPPAPFILPNDMLTPEAQSDPAYIQGHGSMFAAAQPELAMKYGVIRNGQLVPGQALQSPPGAPPKQGKLRNETVEDLKRLKELGAQQQEENDSADNVARQQSESGPAGAAVRIGRPPGQEASPRSDLGDMQQKLDRMDQLDLHQLQTMMIQTMFNNDEQRKLVEDRCEPLDLASLILNGEVTQRIPIVPGTFEPVLRSISAEEDLACKRLLYEETKKVNVSDDYFLDKYAFMGLTCSLVAVTTSGGTATIPSHLGTDNAFDDALFWKKFNLVIRYPLPMLASLGVHYFWFDIRVRKLFVADKIKNG
jgi:hypothetical protein